MGAPVEFVCRYTPDAPSGSTVTIECDPGRLQYGAIRRGPPGTPLTSEGVSLPFDLIREIVAEWVRREKTREIYDQSARQALLGSL